MELSGELDHHGAHTAITQMNFAVESAIPQKLTLDFSNISFMDSSGIALVIRARQQMNRLNGTVCLCGVPRQARKVFDTAGVLKLVSITEGSMV